MSYHELEILSLAAPLNQAKTADNSNTNSLYNVWKKYFSENLHKYTLFFVCRKQMKWKIY